MNYEEAKCLLQYHTMRCEKPNYSNCEDSILLDARGPRRIKREQVTEIISLLEVIEKEWKDKDIIDKDVISYLWEISFKVMDEINYSYLKYDAYNKDEYKKYLSWINSISSAVLGLLLKYSYNDAIEEYRDIFE